MVPSFASALTWRAIRRRSQTRFCPCYLGPVTILRTAIRCSHDSRSQIPAEQLCGFSPSEFLAIHSVVDSTVSSAPTSTSTTSSAIAKDLSALYGEGPDDRRRFRDSVMATLREPAVIRRLRERTLMYYGPQLASMMMPAGQTGLMYRLARLIKAKRVFEVGTFTGMGCLVFALVGNGVQVMSCDIDLEGWEKAGRKVLEDAGLCAQVNVVQGRGVDVMRGTLQREGEEQWDLVFIDGEKEEYRESFELAMGMIRRGGLIVVDDIYWSGRVDAGEEDSDTCGIRSCVEYAEADRRVDTSILPIGDGVLVAMKRWSS